MSYLRYDVYLTDGQWDKVRAAAKAGREVSVRIDPSIRANRHLYLTASQIKKLKKGDGPKDIKLSRTQIVKNGGLIFSIPALLAGLGAIGGLAGSAASVAKAVGTKRHEKKMETEARRHNKQVEDMLRKASGKGAYLPRKYVSGEGAFLPRRKK